MDKNLVLKSLERLNKWWKQEFKLEIYRSREIYNEIQKFLHTKQIISLTGLRRVGKTTLMLKIIEDLLSKYNKENIVYFSFDEFRDIRIEELIETYSEFMKKDIEKGKYLFLLDEIQKVQNWEEQLKSIYDSHPNIKFIISRSESLFIRKNSRESLAGRIFEFKINTLTFKEFLTFRDLKFDNIQLYKKEILNEFKKYLACNGFPEIVNESREIIEKYIKNNIIERIIYRDIPQIVQIKEPTILDQLFRIILKDPGAIIHLDNLATDLKITRQTLSLYLDYLEKSFLLRKLYNFSKNVRKTERRLKKYYPTIILEHMVKDSNPFGKIFETVVVNELEADYFWLDSFKNEVDIIDPKQENLPIEVKSGKVEKKHTKPLRKFMDKFKIKKGLILSYDQKSKFEDIEVIPFYEYILKELG